MNNRYVKKVVQFAKRHQLLMIFLVIWFFGFLVFLALYPGVYGYDINSQLLSVMTDKAPIRDHFSVPFVLLLGGVVNLGRTLFGSYSVGFAMFVLLQLVFVSFVAARLCLVLLREFKKKTVFYMAVAFFCLFPLYTIMAVSVVQDVYFAGFVVLLFIELFFISKNPKEYWKKKINYVVFGGLVLAVCFARNNGLYMLLVALPIIVLALEKGKRLAVFLMILLPVVVYLVIKGPIYGAFSVEKGNAIREISSIPSQQLARVFVRHKDEMSDEQIDEFRRYYNTDLFEKYYELNPSISDQAKAGLDTGEVQNDLFGYFGLWAKNGLKHPLNYIDAFAMNSYAFWFPGKSYPDTRMYHPLIEFDNLEPDSELEFLGIKRESKLPLYENLLGAVVGKSSQSNPKKGAWIFMPVFSVLFTPGFYFVIVLACVMLIFMYKNWRLLVPLAVVVGLYFTLLLSPVGLFRYCLPIIMLAPLMIGMCLNSGKS